MNDPWMQHLEKYGLLELHNEAQHVGYRIRVANGWTFDLEYEGGLAKYSQPGNSLKTFEDTEQGRAEARAFLATVSQESLTLDELLALKAQRPRPLKVVHCGSTDKAREAFQYWRLQDTRNYMTVLTIGADAKDEDLGISPEEKLALDVLHLYKIDEADLVRILNVGGYIGESTRRELEYAQRLGKPIMFLEPAIEQKGETNIPVSCV